MIIKFYIFICWIGLFYGRWRVYHQPPGKSFISVSFNILLDGFSMTVSPDFSLQVFSWISFPQGPENKMSVISNFLKILADIRKSRCTTGTNDTGGKFATQGLGGTLIHEKNRSQKSRDIVCNVM
jgi:hypothetical protein